MAALGEVFFKIKEKGKERTDEILQELTRLMDKSIIEPTFIEKPYDTFTIARDLSEKMPDDRDQISPMDSFIVASATVDPNCHILYTTDAKLISNTRLQEIISDWRSGQNYKPISIRDVDDLIKH